MPDAPSDSRPTGAPPQRRAWGRRLLWAGAAVALLFAGSGWAVWTWRAEALNRLLSTLLDRWHISVRSLNPLPGGGIEALGIVVRHPDSAEPVVEVTRAVTTGSWIDLLNGRLRSLTLESPVIRWRNDLVGESDGEKGPAEPFLSWDHIAIRDGRIVVRLLAEPAPPFFDSVLNWEGGGATIFRDGSMQVEEQTVSLQNPQIRHRADAGNPAAADFQAESLTLTASLDRASRRLSLSNIALANPVVRVEGRLAAEGPGAPAVPALPPGGPVESVSVSSARATGLDAALTWPLAPDAPPLRANLAGDLSAEAAAWSAPDGLTLSGSVAATVDAGDGLKSAAIEGSAQLDADGPRVSSLTISGAVVSDLPSVLLSLGVPAESVAALPPATGTLDVAFRDLRLAPDGPESAAVQSVRLRDLAVDLPGVAALRSPEIRIEAVPDEVTADRRIRLLQVAEPTIATSPSPVSAVPPVASPSPDPPPADTRAAWEDWTADELTVTPGSLTFPVPAADGSVLRATVQAETVPADNGRPKRYRLRATDIALTHPDFPASPVAAARSLEVEADPATMWDRREIAAVTLLGLRAEVGDALFRIVGGSTTDDDAPAAANPNAPAPAAAPWTVARTTIDDTLVQLADLGDGARLDVPVKRLEFPNLPLDASALSAIDEVYKIELPNITIYSPWAEGQKVAVLESNFIHFSPSGLLNRRLEKVEVMVPSLYAGEPLFQYIDACRARFQSLTAGRDRATAPLLAAADAENAAVQAAVAQATEPAAGGWHIPLYTAAGRVIVAPRGSPWPQFPVIPFRNARDRDGTPVPFVLDGSQIHGELAVEPGWYHFPDYKLSVRVSDRGRIVFNTPVSDTDNNLVEVFEDNTIIYRQITVDEVWLAVTYDDGGIYARFGGTACGGSLTGGANVYLDELYTWDAWASITGADLAPLTAKLTPEYLTMDGVMDELTVRASGDATSLYQAFADLKISKPGRLRIDALDGMKEKMAALEPLARDLAAIGVGALQDFEYRSCQGTVRLFGAEGKMNFRLSGDTGSRNVRIHLHDYRAELPMSFIPF